ncbi:MAG: PAS domain-containing protein [Chthonomonadaceae bacterium]|nr:PAS domain-containing protein [Chthonomonadaceae bacterium]
MPPWIGYAVASAAVAGALWLRLGLDPLLGPRGPIALLLFAVVVSAYIGGIGPGLFASVATAVLGAVLFLRGDTGALGYREQVVTASYTLVALTITWLCERLRNSAIFNREIATHLEDSRLRMASLLDSVTDGLVVVAPDLRLIQVNDEAIRAMGASKTVLGRTLWEVAPHWVSTEIEAKVREALATSAPQRLEQFDEKRGAWLDVAVYPSSHGLVIYLRDITARKRDEADVARISMERARAYAKLDALLANAPIGLAYFDREHRYLRINNYLAEINGVPALDSIGRPIGEVLPSLAPAIEPMLDQVFRTKLAIQNVEIAGETPREPHVPRSWLVSFYPVIDDLGRVQAVGEIVTEITERKRNEELLRTSEERNRLLVEVAANVVWSTDADGRIVAPQAQWQFATGQGWLAQQGKGWLERFAREDRPALRKTLRRGIRERTAQRLDACLWSASHEEFRYVSLYVVPLKRADGSVEEWIWMASDVHEKRLWEQEREGLLAAERSARSEAERANALKDDFIATMSHELRTPLTTILGWAELLQLKADQPETLLQGLKTIERSTRIQSQLIEDLLDLSRIGSGKLQLEREVVDLGTIVQNAVDSLRQRLDEKGVKLSLHIPEGPCRVDGDDERLTQVVWNILNNAVKFTPAGGRIRVRLNRTGNQASLRVADNGEGIDEAFLPFLFDRFRQGDSTSSRKHGGLGLGLAIVKELVELHGGTVEASSAGRGKGATFVVELPLSVTDEAPPPKQGNGSHELRGLRLMVVDDDEYTTEVLSRLLTVQGATVDVFHSADEALEAMASRQPDVLISDLSMPQKDGLEFIRELRESETGARTPAIALTAFARTEDRESALNLGFDDHLAKPIDRMRLTESIRRVLHAEPPT